MSEFFFNKNLANYFNNNYAGEIYKTGLLLLYHAGIVDVLTLLAGTFKLNVKPKLFVVQRHSFFCTVFCNYCI